MPLEYVTQEVEFLCGPDGEDYPESLKGAGPTDAELDPFRELPVVQKLIGRIRELENHLQSRWDPEPKIVYVNRWDPRDGMP